MVRRGILKLLSPPGLELIVAVQNGPTSLYAIIFMAISPLVRETKKQKRKFLNFSSVSLNPICIIPHKMRLHIYFYKSNYYYKQKISYLNDILSYHHEIQTFLTKNELFIVFYFYFFNNQILIISIC